MAHVLVIGYDPEGIPGADGPALRAALDAELARFATHDVTAGMVLVEYDEHADAALTTALTGHAWDVVVIGGGIRKAEPLLPLFETTVNLVRRHAPQAAIAFNTPGGDSVEAALRHLPDGAARGESAP
ncbi:hypothetical protein [Streptomyces sp. SPB074]|uniref:hypothetical protein n=1 Tax=Streptomyces sp. (strain SPB074) TaxID=465543 RepID=UPI00017F1224|nr:hypothetical protein [Streptomyces sp. SPB074]EDY43621.1 conserved hypothetical protein [Streptomyces sp. SPB074]